MIFAFMPSPLEMLILGAVAVGLAIVVGLVVAATTTKTNRPDGQ